jgi:hypothetical protein
MVGRGTGGNTSSCTLRGVEEIGVAELKGRVASLIGDVNEDAGPYFFLHIDVSCVVERGWLVHAPAANVLTLPPDPAFFFSAAAVFLPLVDADEVGVPPCGKTLIYDIGSKSRTVKTKSVGRSGLPWRIRCGT